MAELSPDIRETIRELPVGREWLFYLGGNDSARATASWTHRSSRLPPQPVGLHGDEAAHWAAGEVHRAGVRSRGRFVLAAGIEADDQLVAVDAASTCCRRS
jgi:hypothetical protein